MRKISRWVSLADLQNENPEMSLPQLEERLASRRHFLKTGMVASAALLPMSSWLSACASAVTKRTPNGDHAPVIILGGGVAGLTAAYQLSRAGVACEIFEASARLGGRMFTKTGFNSEGMTCELGGELVDNNHEDLIGLCAELGVALDSFTVGDQGLEQNLYYIRGNYHTDADLIPLFQPFAKRLRKDQAKAFKDSELTDEGKKLDQVTLAEYLHRYHDVEKWIVDMIRVAYVGECGLEANEQSALNLLSTLSPDTDKGFKIYGDSDQSQRIRGGNISLIQALVDALQKAGVPMHTSSPLVGIQTSGKDLKLSFAGADSTLDSTLDVISSKVICTIPFSVLRRVSGIFDLPMSPLKKECIRDLGYGSSGKLMLGYQEKIWRQGLQKGGSKIPASNGMVYSDLPVQNVWETSRTQNGKSGILTCYVAGRVGAGLKAANKEPFINHVDNIFPGTKKIADGNFAVMNWTNYRYNLGAYACPKPGQTSKFGRVAGQTELDGKLLFAGEHAADQFAGFMNGALRSGKLAALEIIKQKSPAAFM